MVVGGEELAVGKIKMMKKLGSSDTCNTRARLRHSWATWVPIEPELEYKYLIWCERFGKSKENNRIWMELRSKKKKKSKSDRHQKEKNNIIPSNNWTGPLSNHGNWIPAPALVENKIKSLGPSTPLSLQLSIHICIHAFVLH